MSICVFTKRALDHVFLLEILVAVYKQRSIEPEYSETLKSDSALRPDREPFKKELLDMAKEKSHYTNEDFIYIYLKKHKPD